MEDGMICRIYTLAWAILIIGLVEKAAIHSSRVSALAESTGVWPRNLLLLSLILFVSVIAHHACCGIRATKGS
jgi:hypothetical protein